MLCFMMLMMLTPVQSAVPFHRDFAPQQGMVADLEKPFRSELCLNGLWQFQPMDSPQVLDVKQELPMPDAGAWDKVPIKIPSPWNVNSFSSGDGGDYRCFPSYPAAWEQAKAGWLKRSFRLPKEWRNRQIILRFEAVAGDCIVMVNGKRLAQQFDSFMPLQVDITDAVKPDAVNELLVGVRKPDLYNVTGRLGIYTYPTGSFWGMHIAGIWQDVSLLAIPKTSIDEMQVDPDVGQSRLTVTVSLRGASNPSRKLGYQAKVYEWQSLAGKATALAPEPKWRLGEKAVLSLAMQTVKSTSTSTSVELSASVGNKLKPWSPESPKLYGVVVELIENGKIIDRKYTRFGWRQFTIKGSALLLNGKPIQLKGDAWHFMGVPQMTRRYAWSWFTMLKQANANAVRLHAQPYPSFYLDVADEMGIMVLDESAIWASHCSFNYDAPEFWERSMEHIESLVKRDRNHPSVFGWSVSNEINAALGVVRSTKNDQKSINDQVGLLIDRVRELDPTRPWISGDGEEDMGGRFPVAIGHYGDLAYYERLSKLDKPYGIGEACSAYYSTPKEVASWYGDRAYESCLGRMEGVATEAYELLVTQRKTAAYCSIFNLAWYGLKPLPIGLADTSHAPQPSDGISFPKYVEGKAGMQPERLGAYSTTFNPGYDSALPLYQSWPLFDAVKAAYAPGKPLPCEWDHKPAVSELKKAPLSNGQDLTTQPVLIGKSSGQVAFAMARTGVPYGGVDEATIVTKLLVVDGRTLDAASVNTAKASMDSTLNTGGTVLIWDPLPETLSLVNTLLPAPLTLTKRVAVSLVKKSPSPITSAISLGDLYFGDRPMGKEIMRYGLDGPIVKAGKTLLEACNTDWRRWGERGENIKTGSVYRSELEAKPSGCALVEIPSGKGRILICTILPLTVTPQHVELTRSLMAALGVKLEKPAEMRGGVFDGSGCLKEALMIGAFNSTSYESACDTDFLGGETTVKPQANDRVGEMVWKPMRSNDSFLMDFNRASIPGTHANAAVYLSFWLECPRPLDQLLAAPDVPKVDLFSGSDDGLKIWLNGQVLLEDKGVHPLVPDGFRCPSLPLKKGWNHFVVKVSNGSGEWQFAARLQCSDPRFLAEMSSSLTEPNP